MKSNPPEYEDSGFPGNLSQPARRALAGAGYTRLEQLSRISEAEIKQLHGMGPKAIGQLRQALEATGLSFADGKKGQADDNHTQDSHQPPTPAKSLERLAGTWHMEISMPLDPPLVTRGQAVFEWLEEGPFLVGRSSVEHASFPTSTEIIGGDDSTGTYSMLYFDSRGVSRIYQMSLGDKVWKLWREAPGFSQRFTGIFSDDGNTIKSCWESSSDGSNWEHDFDLTYTRAR
jgi:hypothetical protein